MIFSEILAQLNLTEEYDLTKNEYRNYWGLIQEIALTDPDMAVNYINVIYGHNQKRYDALQFINKSLQIKSILSQLNPELLDDLTQRYNPKDTLFQGLLESQHIGLYHQEIKEFSQVLLGLNTLPNSYISNLLNQSISVNIWEKINKIQSETSVKWLFENLVFGEAPYMTASGFLSVIQNSTITQVQSFINLYQTTRLDIIRIVDQALNNKIVVADIHKIFINKKVNLKNRQALLKGLTGNHIPNSQDRMMWQYKISTNFFSPIHEDVTEVLDKLLLISQENIMTGLLNLSVKFGHNGYCRMKLLLQNILQLQDCSVFLAELAKFDTTDIELMLQELVWSNQGDVKIANHFLNFIADLTSSNLNQFLTVYIESIHQTTVFPHLIQSIETNNPKMYGLLTDEKGAVCKSLLIELQMLDCSTREQLCTQGTTVLFNNLKKLDHLPFVLAGMLKIESPDNDVYKTKDACILDVLHSLIDPEHPQQDFKNIAYSINHLANRHISRQLIPFIQGKAYAINRLSFDNTAQGRKKSELLLKALCHEDGFISQLIIEHILNHKGMVGSTDDLFYKNNQGEENVLESFLKIVEKNSTAEDISEQYNSFLLADNDPYRFVRLLTQIATSTIVAEKYFETMMKKNPLDRKQMVIDVIAGGQIELLFDDVIQSNETVNLFHQLTQLKKKNTHIYNAMLVMLSKTDNPQTQEFKKLINLKTNYDENYGNVLEKSQALNLKNSQISYQNVICFINEIYKNDSFITTLNQAFDENIQEETDQLIQLFFKIHDKSLLMNAFSQISQNKCILLLKAFAQGYDDLLAILNNIDQPKHLQYLLEHLCYDNITNANYPLALCENLMTCLSAMTASKLQEYFVSSYDDDKNNLILDFETTLKEVYPYNASVLDYTKVLLKEDLFMFICKQIPPKIRQDFLMEILADINCTLQNFYINTPYVTLPLLAMYGKQGDFAKIDALRQQIAHSEDGLHALEYFIHPQKDPYAKLIIALLATTVSADFDIDLSKIKHIYAGIHNFPSMRQALFRFASRPNIHLWQMVQLLKFLSEEDKLHNFDNKINMDFSFPYKKLAVVEDDWVYKRYLEAIEFYEKK